MAWSRAATPTTSSTQVQDFADSAANSAGFRMTEIALTGEHQLSREEILALAGITGRSSLLFLDAAHARARLLANPWIAEATVLKLYPDRLRIGIKERARLRAVAEGRPGRR